MNIGIVKRIFSLRRGGSERYCVNLTRALRAMGHHVSIVGEQIDPELQDQVDFYRVKVSHVSSWAKNRSFARNSSEIVRTAPFDITLGLCHSPAVDVFRVTIGSHRHWMDLRYRGRWQRGLQCLNPRHRAVLQLDGAMFRRSPSVRRIVVQSRLDKRLVMEREQVAEDKIDVVYNGVDTTVFHPGVRRQADQVRHELGFHDGQPMILFASAYNWRLKGLKQLFHAMQTMRYQGACLVVVGNGPRKHFASLAERLGIEQRVKFLDRQPRIARLYAAADLFVLPSVYEPFPNVNLESMACGTPVLTSASCGGADLVEDGVNGYVVPSPEAVREMADRLDHHVALSQDQRARMSHDCWERAKKFTVQANAETMVTIFEQVLREKSRAA